MPIAVVCKQGLWLDLRGTRQPYLPEEANRGPVWMSGHLALRVVLPDSHKIAILFTPNVSLNDDTVLTDQEFGQ
jgi:hypothetical protein